MLTTFNIVRQCETLHCNAPRKSVRPSVRPHNSYKNTQPIQLQKGCYLRAHTQTARSFAFCPPIIGYGYAPRLPPLPRRILGVRIPHSFPITPPRITNDSASEIIPGEAPGPPYPGRGIISRFHHFGSLITLYPYPSTQGPFLINVYHKCYRFNHTVWLIGGRSRAITKFALIFPNMPLLSFVLTYIIP